MDGLDGFSGVDLGVPDRNHGEGVCACEIDEVAGEFAATGGGDLVCAVYEANLAPDIGFALSTGFEQCVGGGGEVLRCPGGLSGKFAEGGGDEAPEGDEGGGRITGKAEVEFGALGGEGEGLARFDGDFADVDGGVECFEESIDVVVVADADAPGRNHNVSFGEGFGHCGFELGRVVGDDAVGDRFGADLFDQGGEGVLVGIDDLAGAEGLIGFDEFAASGEDGDFGLAEDGDCCDLGGGEDGNFGGGECGATLKQWCSGLVVGALFADELLGFRGFEDGDLVGVALGVFLHYDGIGSGGHHGAGEDAGGLAWGDGLGGGFASRNFFDDFEGCGGGLHVGVANSVTIHGGVIPVGEVEFGGDVLGQDAIAAVV